MAAPVKLTVSEGVALVAALEKRVGYDALAFALVGAIGAERAGKLIAEKQGRISKAETVALIKAILPLVPGATLKAKIKTAIAGLREAIPDKARADAILAYVAEKIKEYKYGQESQPSASSAYQTAGTVCGYGPVNNHWRLPDHVVDQILNRMQLKNVRAYKVESVGHANEDVLGTPSKLEQMKRATLYAVDGCAKRGIYYHVTMFNDNAGKSNWRNDGPALSKRLPQAKAFIDWFAETVSPKGVFVVIVGETRTTAGKELEKYGAKKLKAAGFKIGNNNGSRPQETTSFGGIRTDFFEYHPVKTTIWPKHKAAHVTSDTGAILAQLNEAGNVYGRGNPAAISAWRAAGVAAGYAFVIYYGFDVAEYDEPAIDAMGNPQAKPSDGGSSDWPAELAEVAWLHASVRDWPQTAKMSASISGGQIQFPYDKATAWPVATSGTGKDTNANVWAIAKVGGRWQAGTWEWLRKGQTSKPVGCLDGSKGDHFKVKPLSTWRPKSGERFYILVSGHARTAGRTVKERSNVSEVVWP